MFAIASATYGMWFVFHNPSQELATLAVEAISALSFFYARWCQLIFLKLYQEAAYAETVALFAGNALMQSNVPIFQDFVRSVMQSRGTVLTNARSVKDDI
jgi:hypothetical protein